MRPTFFLAMFWMQQTRELKRSWNWMKFWFQDKREVGGGARARSAPAFSFLLRFVKSQWIELKIICRNKLATKFTWRAGAWQPPPENARADSGSRSPPWTSSFFVCALVICIMFSLLYLWKMKHEMQILTCAPLFACLVWSGEGDKPTGRAPVGMLHSDQKKYI